MIEDLLYKQEKQSFANDLKNFAIFKRKHLCWSLFFSFKPILSFFESPCSTTNLYVFSIVPGAHLEILKTSKTENFATIVNDQELSTINARAPS